jgi:hypothetical protein
MAFDVFAIGVGPLALMSSFITALAVGAVLAGVGTVASSCNGRLAHRRRRYFFAANRSFSPRSASA